MMAAIIPSIPDPAKLRRDLLLVTGGTLLLLVSFLNKAYHIDDTLFLMVARHIVQDPVNFYGFTANWYGFPQAMSSINQNPPLVSYYIALASLLGGFGEPVIHAAFLVPAILFAIGTYLLARRLHAAPLFAAFMALCTPAFALQATNVMSDVLMCTFYVWAVLFWVIGMEGDNWLPFLLSALAVSLGFLTKYFAASAILLLAVYTIGKEKKLSCKLLWLLLPLFVIAVFQWRTMELYGHGLLGSAVLYPSTSRHAPWSQILDKILIGLSFTGGSVALSLFTIPLICRRNLRWTIATVTLFAVITAILLWRGSLGSLLFQPQGTIIWGKLLQASLWVTVGIHIFAVALATLNRDREMTTLLLLLWTVGTFFFSVFINWTINGRTILPMVPAVAILHARFLGKSAHGRGEVEEEPSLAELATVIIPATLLTMIVTGADTALANAQRTAAAAIMNDVAQQGGKVWFQGHWGFQYYMEQHGATAFNLRAPALQPGDWLALPMNNTNTKSPAYGYRRTKKYSFQPLSWLTTMRLPPVGAGYYADIWGPLPFAFGPVPDEEYLLFSYTPAESPSR